MANILIIEDEQAIRRVLRNILTEENKSFNVEDAENGKAGLDKMAETNFDLVLCDIKMPG
ncbi:MAG: response regulator, partial [Flavobacteriia bacterium]|nr:response regulator [Flavobacteriia bacterium]